MKKIFLSLLFLSLTVLVSSQAPSLQWVKAIGSTGNDDGVGVKVDTHGNIYAFGYFTGIVDFDPGPSVVNLSATATNSIFVCKLDSSGDFLWAKSFSSKGRLHVGDLTFDKSANVILAGAFGDTVDFDPSAGTYNVVATLGYSDGFILKMDQLGNFVWVKTFGEHNALHQAAGTVEIYSIAIDANNSIYTGGDFNDTIDFDPGIGVYSLIPTDDAATFFSKLDSNGNFVWAKSISQRGHEGAKTIAVDSAGNFYSIGTFWQRDSIDFDPGVGTHILYSAISGTNGTFALKLDTQGDFVWVGIWPYNVNGNAIALDKIGNIYCGGVYTDTVDFDPGVNVFNLYGSHVNNTGFVLKLDNQGAIVWAKGGMPSRALVLDENGNSYTSSNFIDTVDCDPGPGIYSLSTTTGERAITKLDANGNFIWAEKMDGSIWGYGHSLALDGRGNLYATGSFTATANFDPYGANNLTAAGSADIFIQKLGIHADTSNVWPGDANADGIADNNDILTIGQEYTNTGPVRNNASLTWVAQPASNWNDTLTNGNNAKHADCDGSGTINASDTIAVTQNYGLFAHKDFQPDGSNDPKLYLLLNGIGNVQPGQAVHIPVMLGESTLPVNDIYGLALSINCANTLVEVNSIQFAASNSWMGTQGTDLMAFHKDLPANSRADLAIVRTNHTNTGGNGQIGILNFTTKQNVGGALPLSINSVNAIKFDGTQVPLSYEGGILFIGIDEALPSSGKELSIYPNPNNGQFNITLSKPIENAVVEIYNNIGSLVYNHPAINQTNTIDLSSQSNGLYFVRVVCGDKLIASQKIVKQ